MRKKVLGLIICSVYLVNVNAQVNEVVSYSGKIKFEFVITANGLPEYSIAYNGIPVIHPSGLGLILDNNIRLDTNLNLLKADTSVCKETWEPVWGEVKQVENKYRQLKVSLKQKQSPFLAYNIIFRVFDDAVAFRYEFPMQASLKFFAVTKELSNFRVGGDHKSFWIPGDFDSNEYLYTTSKLSEVDAWKQPLISYGTIQKNIPDQWAVQTPLLLKTREGLYVVIHEAALVNYPAMQLHVDKSKFNLSSNLVPNAEGVFAYERAPFSTPWRTIIVSDKATDLLASKTIVNLNEPSKLSNTSWIKPMKFMGVWWEMQTGKTTWNYTGNIDSLSENGQLVPHGHHGANTENVKRYIDFASANGIKGLLVEGWNTGWEEWMGVPKEQNFDFVTPYPDYDVKAITAYAKSKGVQVIMHNETGGNAANYDRMMDTAFRFMNAYSFNSVKTGYVGKINPAGEHHDGQAMINHYQRSIEKAASYKVMIDIHEPARPTGLHRTWPNFMACEAGRGNEWNAFTFGSPPEHETILPFTRLMGGPMDYTPGIFKLKNYAAGDSARQMHTTLCKQLALYVTMYSPLQMVADLPENYAAHPDAFRFIKDVPVDWDDTKILEAEPGDYITIARKEKNSDNWYIGCITDENKRQADIPLSFLPEGKKYTAIIYRDASNADWKTNPEAYTIEKFIVTNATHLKLMLASGGGAAVSIKPALEAEIKSIKAN